MRGHVRVRSCLDDKVNRRIYHLKIYCLSGFVITIVCRRVCVSWWIISYVLTLSVSLSPGFSEALRKPSRAASSLMLVISLLTKTRTSFDLEIAEIAS